MTLASSTSARRPALVPARPAAAVTARSPPSVAEDDQADIVPDWKPSAKIRSPPSTGRPASKRALAGSVCTLVVAAGVTQGQGSVPKKAGFAVRYSEEGSDCE